VRAIQFIDGRVFSCSPYIQSNKLCLAQVGQPVGSERVCHNRPSQSGVASRMGHGHRFTRDRWTCSTYLRVNHTGGVGRADWARRSEGGALHTCVYGSRHLQLGEALRVSALGAGLTKDAALLVGTALGPASRNNLHAKHAVTATVGVDRLRDR